jgi:AraC family transcriptional regulator of adaptative response/methylated-DNA-[protein]-cysteine methyltransferase
VNGSDSAETPLESCAVTGAPRLRLETVRAGVRPSLDRIAVARIATPFGNCVVGSAGGAVCFLEFVGHDEQPVMRRLEAIWPGVQLEPMARPGLPPGSLPGDPGPGRPPLHLRGTPFQLRVWAALLGIPAGTRSTYREIAGRIGAPRAARAVAGAVAANHIAVLVPCHRVVRADGSPGGYRWGTSLKLMLLTAEQAALHPSVIRNAVI